MLGYHQNKNNNKYLMIYPVFFPNHVFFSSTASAEFPSQHESERGTHLTNTTLETLDLFEPMYENMNLWCFLVLLLISTNYVIF